MHPNDDFKKFGLLIFYMKQNVLTLVFIRTLKSFGRVIHQSIYIALHNMSFSLYFSLNQTPFSWLMTLN